MKVPPHHACCGTDRPSPGLPAVPRRGFTLVEILVVVAIVLVLAALSLVGINKATQAARQAKALGPLRELASAGVAYSGENAGQINTMRFGGDPLEGSPPSKWVENTFWGRMEPYIFADIEGGNQQKVKKQLKTRIGALFATKDPDQMTGTVLQGGKIYHDTSGLPVPVAFNRHLVPWNKWTTMAQVDGGAGTIYMAYGFGLFDEEDGGELAEWPQDGSKPDNNLLYLPNKKAMIAFLDGHVEYYSPPIPKRLYHPDFLTSTQ